VQHERLVTNDDTVRFENWIDPVDTLIDLGLRQEGVLLERHGDGTKALRCGGQYL
jgi:hypothetical protein